MPAKINGDDVPWLADADSRLGPVLEAIMDGKYYWIPFDRIRAGCRLPLRPMCDIWCGCPPRRPGAPAATRYLGSDPLLRYRTGPGQPAPAGAENDMEEMAEGQYRGLGQRMLTAGDRDFAILDVRSVEWAGP